MRAARLVAFNEPLSIEDIPIGEPKGTEVLVKILGSGLCHSDIHLQDGMMPLPLPLTPGHENAGEVAALGPAAKGIAEGEAVAVFGGWGCGTCRVCLAGDEQLCNTLNWVGIGHDGGYAEYLMVPHPRHLVPLNGLDPVQSAPLVDAGLTPYRASKKALDLLLPGTSALVVGAGGLGQLGIQILKAMTPAKVIVADISEEKLERAKDCGADETIVFSPSAAQEIQTATGGGAQAVFDYVGSDETLGFSVASAAKGSLVVVIGLALGTLPWNFLGHPPEMQITASYWGNVAELREVLDLARSGLVSAAVEAVQLEEINGALDRLRAGSVEGRVVIVP